MNNLWHITLASEGRMALFASESALRQAVRALARVAGTHTLLFCIMDDHVHAVLSGERQRVGCLGRAMRLGLRCIARAPVDAARIRQVEDHRHLMRLLEYVLSQPAHHGLATHPALWTGSCLADLVGARVVGALGVPLADVLPRMRQADILAAAHMPARSLQPCDDQRMRHAGAARLVAAAAASLSLGPGIAAPGRDQAQARNAVAALAKAAHIAPSEVAFAMGCTERALRRCRGRQADERIVQAVRLRVAVDDTVAALSNAARLRP